MKATGSLDVGPSSVLDPGQASSANDDGSGKGDGEGDSGAGWQGDTTAPDLGTPPQLGRPLIDNAAWEAVHPDDAPFAFDPAAHQLCLNADYGPELVDTLWFSVQTDFCNWITVRQPAAVALDAGEELRLRIWQFALTIADGPFTVVVSVGDPLRELYRTTRPVPADSGLILEVFPLEEAISEGEPVYWHLSNHGDNSWGLIELSAP